VTRLDRHQINARGWADITPRVNIRRFVAVFVDGVRTYRVLTRPRDYYRHFIHFHYFILFHFLPP
jgi:hypothetical protein